MCWGGALSWALNGFAAAAGRRGAGSIVRLRWDVFVFGVCLSVFDLICVF